MHCIPSRRLILHVPSFLRSLVPDLMSLSISLMLAVTGFPSQLEASECGEMGG